jgi:hypothetical protein
VINESTSTSFLFQLPHKRLASQKWISNPSENSPLIGFISRSPSRTFAHLHPLYAMDQLIPYQAIFFPTDGALNASLVLPTS